ncbi:hypothetical protein MARU1_001020 [Malassezia arunalokei]|uniref:Cytochrome c oxidase subunit 8, mitochondrial n=1 Tax=Malassezia arunalokei TaxID=1514897 RepID=A0AAJ6CJA5_9BASI|nr:hypothetical protein MARU1_001020 [Malassezia arunalokei]
MSAIFAATRASLRNTRAPTMMLRRSLHIENTTETVLPFRTGRKHKTFVGISVASFFATGLILPTIAALYQQFKQ